MDLKKIFGARIKELRNKKKLTQFELAEAIGIDEKHLSHIETGRSFPKALLIEKLSFALDVDFNTLFAFSTEFNRKIQTEQIMKLLNSLPDKEFLKIFKLISLFCE